MIDHQQRQLKFLLQIFIEKVYNFNSLKKKKTNFVHVDMNEVLLTYLLNIIAITTSLILAVKYLTWRHASKIILPVHSHASIVKLSYHTVLLLAAADFS